MGIFKETFDTIKKNPTILLLFVILGVIEALALLVVFFSHSEPLSGLLAPPIRRFWGDQFLHYPQNFILLPKLFKYARLMLTASLGLFFTAVVIKKVESVHQGGTESGIVSAGGLAFRRYFRLLIVWVPFFFLLRYIAGTWIPKLEAGPAGQFAAVFVLAMTAQMLTAFLYPAVVLSERNFFKSIFGAFGLELRYAPRILLVFSIPILVGVGVAFAKSLTFFYMRIMPELVLVVLALSIPVMVVVDMLITVAATILYLKVRT